MAYAEVRAVGAITGSASALTPGLPAGLEVGDLLLGFFESGGTLAGEEANAALTAVGWVSVGAEKKGNTRLTILRKIATTEDLRTTNDTGNHQIGRLIAFKKGTFNEESPVPVTAFSTQGSTKSVKCPSIETAVAECLVLFACSGHLPDATGTAEFSAHANANLSEITERIDNTQTSGDGGALMVASGQKATAGTVGESTATAATEAERVTATIAIAPYSDPGSPKPISSKTVTRAEITSPTEQSRPSGEAGDQILVTVYLEANKVISVEGGTEVGEQKYVNSAFRIATFLVPWSNGENVKISWEGNEKKFAVFVMENYRNCGGVDVASNWEQTGSTNEPSCPSVTTTGSNRRVVAITVNGTGAATNVWPEGMTGRVMYSPHICDVHQAASGESGAKKGRLASSVVSGVQTLALKPEEGGETYEASAAGTGTGTGTATALVEMAASAAGTGTGTGAAVAVVHAFASASGTGTGTGTASAEVEGAEVTFDPDYRPPLELDVEIETAEGAIFRLFPQGITFGTQRGDGFGTASFTLSRNILKDYPDVSLLDTVRFVGRQGDIAYEGRIHSFPKANEPQHTINVSCVGWMTYLKSKPCAALIIDRRLASWGDMSLAHENNLLAASYQPKQFAASQGDSGSISNGPGIVFSCTSLISTYLEMGQQWIYAGGEDIAALRYSFEGHGLDADWADQGGLCEDKVASGFVGGTDHNGVTAANQEVLAGGPGKKHAVVTTVYGGVATGDYNIVHRWRHPRVVGDHGLTERGTSPEEGYYLTDIMKYVVNTYYPKIDTSEVQDNTFVLTQFTKHDAPSDGHSIAQELNDYALWELGVWEDRKLHYGPADLSKYDWVLRTDDPGVSVNWQGDSIENFANGIVVTYTDFWGITRTLYPDDYEELRDPTEDNPASRHGEDLWTQVTVPWNCLEGEALQFGRAYLAEYNRPRRPGSYRISGGYLRDGAGHWRQGWQVRNSQTLGILDHPQDFPRLIFSTGWTQDGTALDIQVDGLPKSVDAVVARHTLALQARNIG